MRIRHDGMAVCQGAISLGAALFLAFGLIFLALCGGMFVVSLQSTSRLVEQVSAPVIAHAREQTYGKLNQLFEPIVEHLAVDRNRIRSGVIDPHAPDALRALFLPSLQQLPQCGSMMVADAAGSQWLLMKYDQLVVESPLLASRRHQLPRPDPNALQFLTREVWPEEWGDSSRWTIWSPDGAKPVSTWHQPLEGYLPRKRPWHMQALRDHRDWSAEELRADPAGAVSWTEAYPLFTSKTLGISASMAHTAPSGERVIVAYDLLLDDLSAFTRALRPTPNGAVFVFTEDLRLIGLPGPDWLRDDAQGTDARLASPEVVGSSAMAAALSQWRSGGGGAPGQFAFESGDQRFHAAFDSFSIGGGTSLWLGVLLPEDDFLAQARAEQRLLIGIGALALALAVALSLLLSRWFSRPLAGLAAESRRIAGLDLTAGPRIRTHVSEVRTLSESLQGMREALAAHITERQEAQASLLRSEARLRSLHHSAGDAIFVLSRTGSIRMANARALQLLGYTQEELLGQSVQLVDENWTPEVVAERLDRLEPSAIRTENSHYRRKDGSVIPVEMRIAVTIGEGENQLLIHARDVTRRRELEARLAQSQKMEAMGRLAGGISHDFNNLLTAILGHASLARRGLPDGSEIARQLDSIEQAATRASGMTSQLLAFSRRQIVAPKVVYVDRLVDRMRPTLGRLIGEDVDVRFEAQEGLWPVRIDPVQLEQVILNLAVNARDAMPEGGTLTIQTCNGTLPTPRGDAERVQIKVKDTGMGVKDDVLPHIFEPFFTTKDIGRGTGLGLSTSYGIVQQAGGEISVQSVPGRGSTFTVSLPRVESAVADAEEEQASRAPVGGSETILLVEDESLVRELAMQVLSDQGYRLLAMAGPEAALQAARSFEGEIHLLVTDVVLPGQSGPELVEEILRARPGLAVLYISGFSDHPAVQRQVEEGRHAFLAKPFSPQGLRARVREVLDAHKP